jgi:hypothetical protein
VSSAQICVRVSGAVSFCECLFKTELFDRRRRGRDPWRLHPDRYAANGTVIKHTPTDAVSLSPVTSGRSTDYHKDLDSFTALVAEDALSFKPPGDLIYSYTRASPAAAGKGKGVAAAPDPESEDAVVFEAYHVCSGNVSWSLLT